jgi:VWFA-related protein
MLDRAFQSGQVQRKLRDLPVTTFLAALILTLPIAVKAQQPKPDEPLPKPYSLQVQSHLVVLDVVVTDHAGAIRSDLKAEDFHIAEDGVEQKIVSFEVPSAHIIPAQDDPVSSTAELDKRAPESPVNIVVLDELNTTFQDMAFARYTLKKYLNSQAGAVQAPTMLMAISFDKLTVLHDYTQDRTAVLYALDHHLAAYPWNLQRGEGKVRTMVLSLGAIEQVAQATAGHPGHKNLIWVGKGFPGIDLVSPSLDASAVAGITGAMKDAVNMLRDSRITLYTVDPTLLTAALAVTTDADSVPGLADVPGAPSPNPFDKDASFEALAKTTGGKSFYSRNDVDREIGESVRDGESYYTIAYRPTSSSDESKRFRKISITFATPGLHAAYREGYFSQEPAPPTKPGTRIDYDMDAAIESPLVYTGLTVRAEQKPGAPGTYLVGIPEEELVWSADGDKQSAKLQLIAAVLDKKARILSRDTQNTTERRPLTPTGTSDRGLARLEIQVSVPVAATRVRFVVRELADGRMGTADIQIPDATKPGHPSR